MTPDYSRCTDRLFATHIIGSVIMNMKTAGFSNIWLDQITLSNFPLVLASFLFFKWDTAAIFNRLTKYTHSTTSGKLCNIFLVRHDKIRTTGSERSLEKASICLYMIWREKSVNNETWPLHSSLQNPSAYHRGDFKDTTTIFKLVAPTHR